LFEARFGHDFSGVRLHTGTSADRMAGSVDAVAYTVGRHIVFEHGAYDPHSSTGRRLLAHELAHVVQYDEGAERLGVHRVSKAQCCKADACATPDAVGSGTPDRWTLRLAADREQEGLGRLSTGAVGHTWVKLTDNAGTRHSYGFYPQEGFDSSAPFSTVEGCIHHPDTAHEPPKATKYIDRTYALTREQYVAALDHAQAVCRDRPGYNLVTYNCTTFGIDVAKAADQAPPSHSTLAIDNPNALYSGIEEKRTGTFLPGAVAGGLVLGTIGAALGSLLGPVGAVGFGLLGALAGFVGGGLSAETS
jgi:hypothetical protein